MNRTFAALSALLALAGLSSPAVAQGMPVGTFSNMFQAQIDNYYLGNEMAIAGGLAAYGMIEDWRAQNNYWGPLPNLVSPEQQRESAAALSRAYDDHRLSGQRNSDMRLSGANNYAQTGILGQQPMVGPGGTYYPYVPNDYDRVFDTPQGMVYTNNPMYQPWNGVQLRPVR